MSLMHSLGGRSPVFINSFHNILGKLGLAAYPTTVTKLDSKAGFQWPDALLVTN